MLAVLGSLRIGGGLAPGLWLAHPCAMEATEASFGVLAGSGTSVIASCEALMHRSLGPKLACQERARGVDLNVLAAREQVDCRIAILRPYVDGKMRFRDDDHAGDAPRSEFVEHRLDDGRAGDARSIDECLSDPFNVV